MYLTSSVAYAEPGLQIDLSNKQPWSRQGERYATLQLSVLTWLESEYDFSRPRETDILKFIPNNGARKMLSKDIVSPRDNLELP